MVAKGRMLLKRISVSNKLNSVSLKSALLYSWLIPHLDYNGCYYGDATIIKGHVMPRRKDFAVFDIKKCLMELIKIGLVTPYENNGEIYIHVNGFVEKQPNLRKDREQETEIPPPNTPSSTPSSTPEPDPLRVEKSRYRVEAQNNVLLECFEEFWNEYRKKIDRGKCERWYYKYVNEKTHLKIMAGIKKWKESGKWDDRQYQEYPFTWLNNRRWEFEPEKRILKHRGDLDTDKMINEERECKALEDRFLRGKIGGE